MELEGQQAAQPEEQSTEGQDIGSLFGDRVQVDNPPERKEQPPEPEEDPRKKMDKWAEITEKERQIWRQNKKLKDQQAAIKKEREEIERLRKNPKELLGVKSSDDIESVINNLFDEEERKPENDHKSQEEIYKEVEENVYKRLKEEQQKQEEEKAVESEMREFQSGVDTFIKENEQNYPLTAGMNESKLITEVMQQKYQDDVQAYGEEQAAKMMLSVDEAGRRVEKYLAGEVEKVLQSPQVRSYVQRILSGQNESNGQSDKKSQYDKQLNYGPKTLNNRDFNNSTPPKGIDNGNLTDEEAFERALNLV